MVYYQCVFPHVVPNGNILASGSHDNTIKIWDTLTYQEITTLNSHNDCVRSVCFSQDNSVLVDDKTIIRSY